MAVSTGGISGFLMLFFGTISSIFSKIQLTVPSTGYAGEQHYFEKPGVQVFFMLFGMSLAIPMCHYIKSPKILKWKEYPKPYLLFPAFCATSGTIAVFINTVGLIRVNASIYMMIRGALSIFSSIFSVLFLKRTIHLYKWIGILLCMISLIIVGVAGTQMGNDDRFTWVDRVIGISIIFIAQIIQGAQLVFDEYMCQNCNLHPLWVVGMEGAWGVFINLVIVQPLCLIIPGSDPSPLGGSFESIVDSALMIVNSWKIAIICLVSMLSICFYDIFGMTVTSTLSSVHRTIFEALRTLTVWISMLIIGIFTDNFGEKWTEWSWLELGGFILLVYSSLVFNNVLKLPFIKYPIYNTMSMASVDEGSIHVEIDAV